MSIDNVLYHAKATATGGRDGRATSADSVLDVRLTAHELGGAGGDGTNPEQLFAAGYSACFLGAMKSSFMPAQAATAHRNPSHRPGPASARSRPASASRSN